MNEKSPALGEQRKPENLIAEMALAAERLCRLMEQRRELVEACKTIPSTLTKLIREANEHYFRLQRLAEMAS